MKNTLVLATVALAAMAVPAHAATITFDELTHAGAFTLVNPLDSGGFHFSNNVGGQDALGVWGSGSQGFRLDPTGGAVFHNYGLSTTTVTKIGGGLFDLNSIDLGDVYNNGTGGNVTLTFTDGMGTTSQSVTLDNSLGGQTFTFNRTGLSAFTLQGVSTQSGWLQFDNVVVDNNVLGGVPEPASWAMMIAGFGLAGAAMRRRAKVRVTYA